MKKASFKTRLAAFVRSYAQRNDMLQGFIIEAGATYIETNNGQDLGAIIDAVKNLPKVRLEGVRAYIKACIGDGSIGKGKGNNPGEEITVIKSANKTPVFNPPRSEAGEVIAWFDWVKPESGQKPAKDGYKKLEEYVGKLEGINDTTKTYLLAMLSEKTLDTQAKEWWETRKKELAGIKQLEILTRSVSGAGVANKKEESKAA